MKYYSGILSTIAIVLCVWLLVKITSGTETEAASASEEKEENRIEVAVYMSRIQLFASKLYFAGKAENKALYQFYLVELKEAMEELARNNIMDDGTNVSENIRGFGLQSLQVLEKRVGEEGFKNFDQHYQNLVTSCNSCHKISQKGFIVITVPKQLPLDNQDFSRGEYSDVKVDMDGD